LSQYKNKFYINSDSKSPKQDNSQVDSNLSSCHLQLSIYYIMYIFVLKFETWHTKCYHAFLYLFVLYNLFYILHVVLHIIPTKHFRFNTAQASYTRYNIMWLSLSVTCDTSSSLVKCLFFNFFCHSFNFSLLFNIETK
jgi:hypothetical protein